MFLTAVAAAAIAVSARAQVIQAPAGQAYTIANNVSATAVTEVTYQWYRDGQPIAGATDSSYLLPAHLAYGTNVMFKRGVVSSTCPGNVIFTNDVNVSFGMVVGAVNWASVNVAAYQTFATRPDMYTQFYQWNRATAWSATAATVSNWPSAAITDAAWTINPCPSGWRLPTQAECQALANSGSTWVAADTRGNAVAGRFFGANHQTCTLPNNMFGCLFLPATGVRGMGSGELGDQGLYGHFWGITSLSSTNGHAMYFQSQTIAPNNNINKLYGMTLHCVQ